MKNLLIFAFSLIVCYVAHGQDSLKMQLTIPEKWNYEAIEFPPSFAPDLQYKGYEELRFAPGMFNNEAIDYFTYFIWVHIEEKIELNETWISDFFQSYYKGLCTFVGEQKNIETDSSLIEVTFTKEGSKQYIGLGTINDTFNNGETIQIHLAAKELPASETGETQLLIIISAQDPGHVIWEKLGKLGSEIVK